MIPKGFWEKTPKVPLLAAGMVYGCTTRLLSLGHAGHSGPLQERKAPFSQSVLAMFKIGRRMRINKLIIKMSFFYF